jgi:dihydroorotate dehydrogenase
MWHLAAWNLDPMPPLLPGLRLRSENLLHYPLSYKLTPNTSDVAVIAQAVAAEGADAVSLINTLKGLAIDIHKRRPLLANVTGGLSGPAVKPVAWPWFMLWRRRSVSRLLAGEAS